MFNITATMKDLNIAYEGKGLCGLKIYWRTRVEMHTDSHVDHSTLNGNWRLDTKFNYFQHCPVYVLNEYERKLYPLPKSECINCIVILSEYLISNLISTEYSSDEEYSQAVSDYQDLYSKILNLKRFNFIIPYV